MKNLFAISILIVLAILSVRASNSAFPEEDSAKCATLKFERAYEYAAAVFVGKVLKISKQGNTKTVKFGVIKYWKGITKSHVSVVVYENPRFQSPYKKGESYLVYAKKNEKYGLGDGRCSRSRDLNGFSPSVKDDLIALGQATTISNLEK